MMGEFYAGFMIQGSNKIANIYMVPTSKHSVKKNGLFTDPGKALAWQVREYEDRTEIWYEAIADKFRYPVLKKAEGEILEDAMRDIKKVCKEDAA